MGQKASGDLPFVKRLLLWLWYVRLPESESSNNKQRACTKSSSKISSYLDITKESWDCFATTTTTLGL